MGFGIAELGLKQKAVVFCPNSFVTNSWLLSSLGWNWQFKCERFSTMSGVLQLNNLPP